MNDEVRYKTSSIQMRPHLYTSINHIVEYRPWLLYLWSSYFSVERYLPGRCSLLTNTHTVHQSNEQTDDARREDDDANIPDKFPS